MSAPPRGAKVRGRNREQLRDDRAEVRNAKDRALEAMVESGALHPCADHLTTEIDSCARCQWVNEQLGCSPFKRPLS